MARSERSGRTVAGTPSASVPAGTSMLLGTTALAPTVAPVPTTAWWRTTEPEPTNESSSMMHPSRWARCPMTQPLPTTVGKARAGMDHRSVLDRAAGTDGDGPVVASQDGVGPHRRLGPEGHVADHDGVGVDVRLGVDGGDQVPELVDGHRTTLWHALGGGQGGLGRQASSARRGPGTVRVRVDTGPGTFVTVA